MKYTLQYNNIKGLCEREVPDYGAHRDCPEYIIVPCNNLEYDYAVEITGEILADFLDYGCDEAVKFCNFLVDYLDEKVCKGAEDLLEFKMHSDYIKFSRDVSLDNFILINNILDAFNNKGFFDVDWTDVDGFEEYLFERFQDDAQESFNVYGE